MNTVSTISSHAPGYIDRSLEKVVGVQTAAPLRRSIQPLGGIRMAADASKAYGYKLPDDMLRLFTEIRKTHNQGVFDTYTSEMRSARKAGIITACRTHTGATALSAIIAELPCTVSIGWAGTGTESDCPMVGAASGSLQALLCEGFY